MKFKTALKAARRELSALSKKKEETETRIVALAHVIHGLNKCMGKEPEIYIVDGIEVKL